jgi:hypothetical protein
MLSFSYALDAVRYAIRAAQELCFDDAASDDGVCEEFSGYAWLTW